MASPFLMSGGAGDGDNPHAGCSLWSYSLCLSLAVLKAGLDRAGSSLVEGVPGLVEGVPALVAGVLGLVEGIPPLVAGVPGLVEGVLLWWQVSWVWLKVSLA